MARPRFAGTVSNEAFFSFTSGRWLHDKQRNYALRYRKFDVDALKNHIASSAGADRVVSFSKLGEGRCNKVFKAQLTDGRTIIARIPTPLAGPAHLVTASEVATMRFLRDRLGLTQVPRILSWSSRAADTPVGAEYIVMDMADGVELDEVWHTLTMRQKLHVVYQWALFEAKVIRAIRGGGYGSIYYRDDLPVEEARDIHLQDGKDPDFVLGPVVAPATYWEPKYDVPSDLKLDRGPWPTAAAYLKSFSNSERAWIGRFGRRPSRGYTAPWEPPAHLQIPEDHLVILDMYDRTVNFFIPEDIERLRPTLTLLDSHGGNIFLSTDALARDGSIEISAVIDWQHTTVAPLYLCTRFPAFLSLADPAPGQDSQSFLKEHNYLLDAYRQLYATTKWDETWASALNPVDNLPLEVVLPLGAQNCWHGGYIKLKKLFIDMAKYWSNLVPQSPTCPLGKEPFSAAEVQKVDEDDAAWRAAVAVETNMQEKLGVDSDGMVENDQYSRALEINRKLYSEWLQSTAVDDLDGISPDKIWPYDLD